MISGKLASCAARTSPAGPHPTIRTSTSSGRPSGRSATEGCGSLDERVAGPVAVEVELHHRCPPRERDARALRGHRTPGAWRVALPLSAPCLALESLAVDRLPQAGASLEVVILEDASFGTDASVRSAAPAPPRLPRAHLDARTERPSPDRRRDLAGEPSTITLIGRGQVHVFERAERALRRGRALRRRVAAPTAPRARTRVAAARRGARTVTVPPGDVPRWRRRSKRWRRRPPPAGRAQPRPAAHLLVGAAAVGRALVRRHAHRASATPTTPTSSSIAASPTCSSGTSPATTTPATTPTRWAFPSRCCPGRWRRSPAAAPRS